MSRNSAIEKATARSRTKNNLCWTWLKSIVLSGGHDSVKHHKF